MMFIFATTIDLVAIRVLLILLCVPLLGWSKACDCSASSSARPTIKHCCASRHATAKAPFKACCSTAGMVAELTPAVEVQISASADNLPPAVCELPIAWKMQLASARTTRQALPPPRPAVSLFDLACLLTL